MTKRKQTLSTIITVRITKEMQRDLLKEAERLHIRVPDLVRMIFAIALGEHDNPVYNIAMGYHALREGKND